MSAPKPQWLETSGNLLADRRYAYAEALLAEGEFSAAADLFAQIVEIVPHWPPARFGLGKSSLEAGDVNAARIALSAALSLDPEDRLGAAVLLARMSGEVASGAMPDAYVAALFDDYAPRFDTHLVSALDYCAPALLIGAIRASGVRMAFSRGLDLGCGTGLMAVALAGACKALSGVDLSAAMLERAEATGLYDRLEQAELLAFLKREADATSDLVIAADVFCYVPDLQPVFAEARRVLRTGGLIAFTVQMHEGEGVVIGADSRVHHGVAAVENWLAGAGFSLLRFDLASSRKDRGVPVPGAVFVARCAE